MRVSLVLGQFTPVNQKSDSAGFALGGGLRLEDSLPKRAILRGVTEVS